MNPSAHTTPVGQAIEIAVYLGLIALIVAWCFQILSPFISLLAWGAIIAVSIYTPFVRLREKLGGRNKLAVTVIAVIGLAIVIVPSWMFTASMIDSAQSFAASAEAGTFEIKPPAESVKEWPLIGGRLYDTWPRRKTPLWAWPRRTSIPVSAWPGRLASAPAGPVTAISATCSARTH